MKAKDEKWVVPILAVFFVIMVALTNMPPSHSWYDSQSDEKLMLLKVEKLAEWIIQGRNEHTPVLLQSDDAQRLDNIPGLVVIKDDAPLEESLKHLPEYKKWIIITDDGNLSKKSVDTLTSNWKRRVFLLEGGKKAWMEKITASQIDGLVLDDEEKTALGHVRPFFHKTDSKEIRNSAEQERYTAEPIIQPQMLKEEDIDEEEGC